MSPNGRGASPAGAPGEAGPRDTCPRESLGQVTYLRGESESLGRCLLNVYLMPGCARHEEAAANKIKVVLVVRCRRPGPPPGVTRGRIGLGRSPPLEPGTPGRRLFVHSLGAKTGSCIYKWQKIKSNQNPKNSIL